MPKSKSKSGCSPLAVALVVLLVAAGAIGLMWFFYNKSTGAGQSDETDAQRQAGTPPDTQPAKLPTKVDAQTGKVATQPSKVDTPPSSQTTQLPSGAPPSANATAERLVQAEAAQSSTAPQTSVQDVGPCKKCDDPLAQDSGHTLCPAGLPAPPGYHPHSKSVTLVKNIKELRDLLWADCKRKSPTLALQVWGVPHSLGPNANGDEIRVPNFNGLYTVTPKDKRRRNTEDSPEVHLSDKDEGDSRQKFLQFYERAEHYFVHVLVSKTAGTGDTQWYSFEDFTPTRKGPKRRFQWRCVNDPYGSLERPIPKPADKEGYWWHCNADIGMRVLVAVKDSPPT